MNMCFSLPCISLQAKFEWMITLPGKLSIQLPTRFKQRGGDAHLPWVAPTIGGLFLPLVDCSRWVVLTTVCLK